MNAETRAKLREILLSSNKEAILVDTNCRRAGVIGVDGFLDRIAELWPRELTGDDMQEAGDYAISVVPWDKNFNLKKWKQARLDFLNKRIRGEK